MNRSQPNEFSEALCLTPEPRTWGGKLLAALVLLLIISALCVGIARFSHWATLAVFGVMLGGLILWKPFIGLLVVVASLPFETMGMLGDPGQAGAISITKIGGLTTVGAIVLEVLLRGRRIEWHRLINRLSVLVCLLAAVTVISAVLHPTKESFEESVRFVTIVMFFAVTLHLVSTEKRLRAVIITWVLTGALVSAYSILQREYGATTGSEDWEPVAGTVIDISEEAIGVMDRAAGTFTHPIWLALYLTLTVPFTLYLCWTARRSLARIFWILAVLLQAAAITVTYSRMGYLALLLGVSLFLFRRRGGPAVVLWATLLTAATVPMWPGTIADRVWSILDYTESSSSMTRIGQQRVSWWMFRDNFVTGVGPGNFEENIRVYADRVSDTLRVEVIGAHNMYAEVLAELGLQGLLLILAILVLGWRAAERARRRMPDPSTALLREAMAASLVVFAFSAVLIHAQYQKEWWLLVSLIIAGDWISQQRRGLGPERTASPPSSSRQPK